jgi:hypothetical protein
MPASPSLLVLTPRGVGQRIRHGTLAETLPGGKVYCQNGHGPQGDTESVRFWSTGDRISCSQCGDWVVARPRFPLPDGRTLELALTGKAGI